MVSKKSLSNLRDGDRVRVRGQRWRVCATEAFGDCETLHLTGCDRGNRDLCRVLLYPFDRPRPVDRFRTSTVVRPHRWLSRLRSLVEEAASWTTLRGAADARLDLHAYQLEPALDVMRGRACRILLADEVGLGKTIQAGLLLRELRIRGWAGRVLVVTPSGLVDQWQAELAHRFAISATVMDAVTVQRRARSLPAGDSPWALPGVYVASIDFIKRLDVRRAMEQALWDALLVDEAHQATPGTDRGLAVRALARRARYVVLITATPHSGHEKAFSWLSGLGSLRRGDPLVTFRRTRQQIGLPARRPARLLPVRMTANERRLHDLLRRYATAVWRESKSRGDRDARLAMIVLIKRALSSAASLERSVNRRLVWLDSVPAQPEQRGLPLDDPDDSDEPPSSALRAPGLTSPRHERAWLEAIRQAAHDSTDRESKRHCLGRLLRRTSEPVIVFTEYRDTLLDLAATVGTVHRSAVLHGCIPRAERLRVERDFNTGRVRLLLATDVAGAGLNLQASCRWVVNYELPWNPMRLEQRVGRVDRIGQSRPVHALHLVAAESAEQHVLAHLAARLDRVRAAVGHVDHILGTVTPEWLAERALLGDAASRDPAGWPPEHPVLASTGGRPRPDRAALAALAEVERLLRQRRGGRPRVRHTTKTASAMRDVRTWCTRLPGGAWPTGLVLVYSVVTEDGLSTPIHEKPVACLVATEPLQGAPVSTARAPLVPAVIDRINPLDDPKLDPQVVQRVIRQAGQRVGPLLGAIATREAGNMTRDHARFLGRAIRRERDLLRSLRRTTGTPVQAALFDRRAIRQAATERKLIGRLELASQARLARLRLAAEGAHRVELKLVGWIG